MDGIRFKERESLRLFAKQCIDSAIAAFNGPLIISISILIVFIIIYSLIRGAENRRNIEEAEEYEV